MTENLAALRDMFTILAPVLAIVGFGYGVRLRLDRIEKILLGNGEPGMISRLQRVEHDIAVLDAHCEERHKVSAR